MPTERFEGFADTKATFFAKLAKAQTKEWFTAHKGDYEEGWHTPMKLLLAEARSKLDKAFPHVELGEPHVMRIYRDVRFSKDKSPYKTWIINQGPGIAHPFRVAVLASAQSHSIFVGELAPGASVVYGVGQLDCGQAVAVLVDADNAVVETNESDNAVGWNASCRID